MFLQFLHIKKIKDKYEILIHILLEREETQRSYEKIFYGGFARES